MKSIQYCIIICTILCLISSSIMFVSSEQNPQTVLYDCIHFSYPELIIQNNTTLVQIEGLNASMQSDSTFSLPVYQKIYALPVDVNIISVKCETYEYQRIQLDTPLARSSHLISSISSVNDEYVIQNESVLPIQIGTIYPPTAFEYHLGRGLQKNIPTLFLAVTYHPVQYDADHMQLLYHPFVEIEVTYEPLSINKEQIKKENQ